MNQKRTTFQLFLGMMMLVLTMALCPTSARGQETREPLTKPEVTRLLQNGVSPDRVGALAKQYGIAFQVTDEAEKQLREAGANDELIGMLKALSPAPPPAPAAPMAAPQPQAEPPKPAAPSAVQPADPAATQTPAAGPPSPQHSVDKIRVLVAPGLTKTDQKDWDNTLNVAADKLSVNCPKCLPTQTITISKADVVALHYGQNAYHHWVSGIITGVASLGVGLIVGLMPHHQHFYSVDTKDGSALGIQADKSNYKEIAGILQNFAGLPIQVTAKDAHFLSGYNTKVVAEDSK